MCPACGHPQEASERCVACGAALPPPVRGSAPANVAAAAPPEGALSVTLAGRTVTLQHDRIAVAARERHVFPLAEVRAVQLSSRRLVEAFAVAALFAAAAAFGQNPALRMLFAALLIASLVAGVVYRRYSLRIAPASSSVPPLSVSTVARAGSADAVRIDNAFAALHARLARDGVEVLR